MVWTMKKIYLYKSLRSLTTYSEPLKSSSTSEVPQNWFSKNTAHMWQKKKKIAADSLSWC